MKKRLQELALAACVSMALMGCQHPSAPAGIAPSPMSGAPSSASWSLRPDQASEIDALMRDTVASEHLAGASLGIGINGIPVFARGYGYRDLARRLPATPGTIYNIASMSKLFAAAAILLLQQEHKLNIDDPLSRYLPGFAHGDQITVREVLDHTSGLSDYLDLMNNNALTPAKVRATVYRLNLRFAPGSKYEYSNSNYIVAGLIVEKVSGMPYDVFVRTRFFQPLGLRQTSIGTSPLELPGGSYGYTVVKGTTVPVDPKADSVTILDFPDGGVNTTVLDLIAWDDALISGRVISAQMLALMLTPSRHKADWPNGYGLGVGLDTVSGHLVAAHTGGWTGFTGENAWLPHDRIAVALLTNTDSFDFGGKTDLMRRILTIVLSPALSRFPASGKEVGP